MKFKTYEKARIVNTTSSDLDGQIVTIIGKSFDDGIMHFYIVELEKPVIHHDDFIHSAISITEHCLERV